MSSGASIWVEVVLRQAAQHPDRLAFTFLHDGETETARLTYGKLDAGARAIAAQLARRGATPGTRALLLYPPGIEFILAFCGCLFAGVVAVPAYPPRPGRRRRRGSDLRLESIVHDARPDFVLTTAAILARREELAADVPALGAADWIEAPIPANDRAQDWRPPDLSGESLAFLQYTSGSTSEPKGVMVTHANLLHNEEMIRRAFGQSEHSVIVGWLPLYHDMGLIGNVLQPLYLGACAVLMSPMAFLQRPIRWLDAITRYSATTSGGPDFAYDLCVRRIPPDERGRLDLSSWSVAFNGSEPVRSSTLDRFAEAFRPCGFERRAFFPCYGLAEATLFVAGGPREEEPVVEAFDAEALERHQALASPPEATARPLVGCGRAWMGQHLRIVDPETCLPLESGDVGEIWISGPSVAQGYWGRKEQTARDYAGRLAGAGPEENVFLRTGDLGFTFRGELFITGRIKDLIILRGRNHYPQDIERIAESSHPDVLPGSGAAFAVEADGEERLVVVSELQRRARANPREVAQAIRQAVSEEHEVRLYDAVLIRPGTLPRTSSGKVRRKACAHAYLNDELERVRPDTPNPRLVGETVEPAPDLDRPALLALELPDRRRRLESWLRQRLAAVARLDVQGIDPRAPLSAAGLDSLMAVEISNDLESRLEVELPISRLLSGPSLAELTEEVLERLAVAVPPARGELRLSKDAPVEAPLSFGQRALWLLHRMAPRSDAYHVTFAARLSNGYDADAVHRACSGWSDRHPCLGVTFATRKGKPYQRFGSCDRLAFERIDAASWPDERLQDKLAQAAAEPFDLEKGPVLRVHLWERADEGFLLLVAHHSVVDLASLFLLLGELGVSCSDPRKTLPRPAAHYADYVRWQEELLAGAEGDRLRRHWQAALAGASQVLELPTDRPRPATQSFSGAGRPWRVDEDLARELLELAQGRKATPYMMLLAAFQTLLSRMAGSDDFLVGSPLSGRTRPELREVVGYFVNPLPIRADLRGDPTFDDLLDRVRARTSEALSHQDYPAALLVENLAPERDASRNPLFQVLFTLERPQLPEPGRSEDVAGFVLGRRGARLSLGGLELESADLAERGSQLDLTLRLVESGGRLSGEWIYATDLFEPTTVERLARSFRTLLESIVADPAGRVRQVPILHAAGRHQLLLEWNDTRDTAAAALSLHALFEVQAAATPDAEALVASRERWTYAQLDAKAGALARELASRGAGPEVLVGLFLDRSPELLVAILAVLKAGGAYVPLDPAYPQERLRFMLEDTRATLLLTWEDLRREIPAMEGLEVVSLDDDVWRDTPAGTSLPVSGGGHLAYVIYTSGSTGRPKGVAITHASALQLLAWAREVYARERLAAVLASTSICFDLSIFELFAPLSCGGKVVLAESVLHFPTLEAAPEVTLINTVPSAIAELARKRALAGVSTVNLAGEALQRGVVDATYGAGAVAVVFNLYGPSEDTTYSTWERVPRLGTAAPTIGRPVSGTRAHLVDRSFVPVPIGVTGELHLGGAGLARGYLSRPGVSAERFLPDGLSGAVGARLYRTGDLARFAPDGRLDFLGRMDHQVKLRGFRIELGEVESALGRHPDVREAVAGVRRSAVGDERLVAWVACKAAATSEDSGRWASHLRQRLPEYMIPSAFVPLEALPRLPNGKVDRRSLPEPTGEQPRSAKAFVAPSNELERRLAGLWQEVLGTERIGIDDNFFELGGHSLLMVEVHDRLEKLLERQLPVVELFQFPTIRALAGHLSRETEPAPPSFDAVRHRAERKRRRVVPRRRPS